MAFACWQPAAMNTWYPGRVLAKYAPSPPPPTEGASPAPGPFAFGDPAYVEDILEQAGFVGVAGDEVTVPVVITDESIFDRETVDALPVDDAAKERAWADLMSFKESLLGGDGMLHFTLHLRIVRARNP
jgi:hypothetical protein